jgi:hypothetical protein
MATSDAKINSNRANAKKSTGPRTAEGKARSAQNASLDAHFGRMLQLNTDDRLEYCLFGTRFVLDLKPVGPYEECLVETLVDNAWQMKRARGYAEQITPDMESCLASAEHDKIVRYQKQLDASTCKVGAELRQVQKVRRDEEHYLEKVAFQKELGCAYKQSEHGYARRRFGFVPEKSVLYKFYEYMHGVPAEMLGNDPAPAENPSANPPPLPPTEAVIG